MICLNYELYFRETIVYVRMYVVLTPPPQTRKTESVENEVT